MKRLLIISLSIIFLSSCSWDGKFKKVNVENEYSLNLPSFMNKTDILNDVASLQYQDMWREFYVMVIHEKKQEMSAALAQNQYLQTMYSNDLEGYTDLMLQSYSLALGVDGEPDILDGTVDNLPAKFVTMQGTAEGEEIFWKLAFIEGTYNYYQIYTWTLVSKKEEHKIKMNQVLKSFEEHY